MPVRRLYFPHLAMTMLVLACTAAAAQTVTLLSVDYGVEGNRMDVTCRVQSLVQGGSLHFRIDNYEMGGDPAPEQRKELRIRARDYNGRIFDYSYPEKQDVDLQVTDRGPNCEEWGRRRSQWQGRLQDDDQQRFDSYYSRWLTYRQRNDRDEIVSMERRMLDVYSHYGIPNTVPFDQVASPIAVGGAPGMGVAVGAYSDLQIISATYGVPGRTIDVANRLRGRINNSSLSVHVDNDSMGGDPAPEKHKVLTLTYSYRGQARSITVREKDDLNLP